MELGTVVRPQEYFTQKLRIAVAKKMPKIEITILEVSTEDLIATLTT